MNTLRERIVELDQLIDEWLLEERRGGLGVALAPIDQKGMAIDIMRAARAEINKLRKEKEGIQDKIDVLAAKPPNPVRCDA